MQELGKRKLWMTTPPYPEPSTRRRRAPSPPEHLHRAGAAIIYTSNPALHETSPPLHCALLSSIKLTGRSRLDNHPSPFCRPSRLQEPNADALP